MCPRPIKRLRERIRRIPATRHPLLLFMASCLTCLAIAYAPAHAIVPGADAVTLEWSTYNRVYYGGYNTPIFSTVDGAGRVTFAYCVDPTTTVPAAGPYGTISVEDFNPYWASQIRAAMWFGYGGPGFDPSMWPAAWNDGSPMDAPKYYAATHLILSYATTQNCSWVYYNAGSQFINYGATTFLGVNVRGDVTNPNSTMFQMFNRAAEVPPDYMCYYLDCGRWDYTQYVIAQDVYERNGSLIIEKTSLVPEISNGNSCYNLEGATFGIYGDADCTQLEATATTGPNGIVRIEGLRAHTYWVKEIAAPPGFSLNTTVHPIEATSGADVHLTVANEPQADKPPLLVQKIDAQTGGAPQGNSGLAGAEFTLSFYEDLYEEGALPAQPSRTWVFTTDPDGSATLDDNFLISGDPLYRNSHQEPVLPLGTLTIQETKAPPGYLLSDSAVYLRLITPEGQGPTVSTYQAPTIADHPARGGLSIQKVDADTGAPLPQGAASMAGAEFSIVTTNAQPVMVQGKTYTTGQVVGTLATDASGFGSTAADMLPCGTYSVYESRAPEGYLIAEEHWDVAITTPGLVVPVGTSRAIPHYEQIENGHEPIAAAVTTAAGQHPTATTVAHRTPNLLSFLADLLFRPTVAYAGEDAEAHADPVATIPEQVIRGGIRAYKVDADTGTGTPQGDASLEGTEFSIISLNGNPVVVDGVSYKSGSVVKRIYSDKTGMAQTGNRDLPYGYYSVQETGAPPGYMRSSQAVHVNRDGIIVEVGKPYENEVQRGGIRIQKIDGELKSSQPQGAGTLSGTQFTLTNASEHDVMVDGVLYAPGEVVMTLTTGADGVAQTGTRDLPFGTYTVIEVTAPAGYHGGGGATQTIEVHTDNTLHEASDPFVNYVFRGGVSLYKCDADTKERSPQGNASLEGACFSIANANDNPVVVDGKTYWPGETVATITTDAAGYATTGDRLLPIGSYTITEVSASPGYLTTTAPHTVRLQEDGVIVPLAIDIPEPVQRGGFGLRKFDAETMLATPQGSSLLQGARYHVINASAGPVVVGTVRYEPGEVVTTLVTNRDGWAQTGAHDLPFGTYEVVEVQAPHGYALGRTDAQGQETGEGVSCIVTIAGERDWHSLESSFYDQVIRGGIGVVKIDADLQDQPQGNGTLEGAEFTIANASTSPVLVGSTLYEPGAIVARLVTGPDGRAATGPRDLPFGSYTVSEVRAPNGYALDAGSQLVTISEEGVIAHPEYPYVDHVLRGGVGVCKIDAEIGTSGPQGAASYQGALFEVVNGSPNPVVVEGQVYQTGETVTTLTTDAEGHAATAIHALPFGTYFVREVQPPKGYLLNETSWTIEITDHGSLIYAGEPATSPTSMEPIQEPGLFESFLSWLRPQTAQASPLEDSTPEQPCVPENIVRGGVAVQKVDAETGSAQPQGDATLGGTRFSITSLNANPVVIHGNPYYEGDVVMTIETGADGRAASPERSLPYGTYAIAEVSPPVGYQPPTAMLPRLFAIEEDGITVDLEEPFANSPVRGGVAIQKNDYETNGNIPLGEATLADTRFSVINASPHPVCVEGSIYEPGSEIMVLRTDIEGTASTDSSALPFGTYEIREVLAPEGYNPNPSSEPVYVTVRTNGSIEPCPQPFANRVIRGDIAGIKIEDETLTPMAHVAFKITSLTTGESHVLVTNDQGEFSTASAQALHTYNTNANDAALDSNGHVADESLLSPENGLWFSGATSLSTDPDDSLGALPFDRYRFDELLTSANHGHTLVSFEVSVRQEGAVVDAGVINNDIIGLHSNAYFTASGASEGAARSDVRVTDAVSYTNLTPGVPYQLIGTLFDRRSREPLIGRDGQPITAKTSFIPSQASGTIELAFEFDALSLAGTRAVAVGQLLSNGQEIALHNDLANNNQTVTFVAIGTRARGQASGTHEEQAAISTCIVDTVRYEGLAPGKEYLFTSTLIDRSTGQELCDQQGRPIVVHTTHTPSSPQGSVDIEIVFDGSELAGHTLVVFETVQSDGHIVASHADIDDSEQAVTLVALSTRAVDQGTGSHQSEVADTVTILDTITFSGLEPGAEYTVEGLLVHQQTGIPLLGKASLPIASSVHFVPDEAHGEITVAFTFDATQLAGQHVVAVETLLRNGTVIASHANLNDPEQTIFWAAIPNLPALGYPATWPRELPLALAGAACAFMGIAAALLLRHESRAA